MLDKEKQEKIELKLQEIENNLVKLSLVLKPNKLERERKKEENPSSTKWNLGILLHLLTLAISIPIANYVQGEEPSTIYTRAIVAFILLLAQALVLIVSDMNGYYRKGV